MIKNKLKINDSKTEYVIFRSPLLKQNLSNMSIIIIIIIYIYIAQYPANTACSTRL